MNHTGTVAAVLLTVAFTLGNAFAAERGMLIVNEDNDCFFHHDSSEMTREGLIAYLDSMIDGGKITDMSFCPCGQPANFDSKVWEPVWKRLEYPETKGWFDSEDKRRWPENCKRLHDMGIDPYVVWKDRCHEKGVRFWLSMRMNDVHFMTHKRMIVVRGVRFTREHPELWRYPNAPFGREWKERALDYSHPEAYAYSFAMAKELLERYHPDGLELDWMRYVCHLTPGKEREQAHILTRYMREVKAIAGNTKISVRLPSRFAYALDLGYEPHVWAKEGLVDVLIPCCKDAVDYETGIAEWRAKCGDVKIVPGMDRVDCTHDERIYADMAGYRGFADAMWRKGADGLYLFNTIYAPCRKEIWENGLSPESLPGKRKRYVATYPDSAPDAIPEKSLCQLPKILNGGMKLTVECGTAEGEAAILLGFDVADAPVKGVSLKANGRDVALDGVTLVRDFGKLYGDPRKVKSVVRIAAGNGVFHSGVNTLEVRGDSPASVYWAEVEFR